MGGGEERTKGMGKEENKKSEEGKREDEKGGVEERNCFLKN